MPPGSGSPVGRAPAAAVAPAELRDSTTCGAGKGHCFAGAQCRQGGARPLGDLAELEAVRGRIVRVAVKIVPAPVFAAGFLP